VVGFAQVILSHESPQSVVASFASMETALSGCRRAQRSMVGFLCEGSVIGGGQRHAYALSS
jgi:hypothetical protein